MKRIGIDSVLLFALVVPFIMTYRIGPSDTPYWLFGVVFLGLLFYLSLDLLRISEKKYFFWKHIVLWGVIAGVIGSAFVSSIIVRHQTHPIYGIHDMPLQQEIAIRFLLDGKNPYAERYFGTFLEQWHYSDKDVNPALYHFVLPPFYILFALPFYAVSIMSIGYFDARMPLFLLFFLFLVGMAKLIKDEKQRLLALILLAFNPAMLSYTLEGRSDVFMYTFLFFSFFLLYKNKFLLAGIPLGLAFAVKQSAWPIFPFYLAFLYFQTKTVARVIKGIIPFLVTFAVVMIPFFLWDQKAFLDSTIYYLSGNTSYSYPISGYGLGKLLEFIGAIKDVKAYYPFSIWQLTIGLPLMISLVSYLKNKPSVGRLILIYGIFLFVFWYFSRYFNNSHLGFLSMVFFTAYFWPEDEE